VYILVASVTAHGAIAAGGNGARHASSGVRPGIRPAVPLVPWFTVPLRL